ncbi:unnamed protein product [Amoebophrya sp. A120]|nr:unnamed protein product [Amoebophrya sp. A120]|eukprot:GSA120T00017894001.1
MRMPAWCRRRRRQRGPTEARGPRGMMKASSTLVRRVLLAGTTASGSWLCLQSASTWSLLPPAAAMPVMRRVETDDALHPECVWKDDPFDDLKDIKIYALIYYGRRAYVDLLNAYLERNLRENGGVLDGVLWALVKYDMNDLQYLIKLQRRNPRSYFIPPIEGGGWDVIWKVVDEPGAYYVKIDDDVVFINDGAIPELIREKRRDRFLFVSANVINHGIVSAVHQELAQYPWLEKPAPNPEDGKLHAWPFRQDVMLDEKFRIEHTFYSDCIWRRWDCAAWAHETLLHRIEEGSLCTLDFGVFDFHAHGYETMSDGISRHVDWNINFFAFKYEDFSDISWDGISTDDEGEFSTQHPKRRNQHAAALGRAVVAHWSFSIQEKGLLANTTLLERYRELAEKLMYENAVNFYDGVMQPRGHAF